jgi:transcriptional regulator with XRE-family HTH domain
VSSPKIGENLREAREAAGLSSGDAAEKIGSSAMSLSRYENDHRLPNAEILLRMVKAYGCDLATLITGTARAKQPLPIPVRGRILDRTKFDLYMEKEPSEFLPMLTDRPGVFALKVVGPAFQPIYFDGEFLILEPSEAQESLEIGRGQMMRGNPIGKLLGVFRKS